jgi:hypothetical protein
MIEDPFNLRKDTLCFILFDPEDMDSYKAKQVTEKSFLSYGYENIKPQLYTDLSKDYGYKLQFNNYDDPTNRKKWYTFVNVLRKIRKEDNPVIITFAGSLLVKDILKSIENSQMEVLGYNFINNKRSCNVENGIFISPLMAKELYSYILQKQISIDIFNMINSYYRNNFPTKSYDYFLMTHAT